MFEFVLCKQKFTLNVKGRAKLHVKFSSYKANMKEVIRLIFISFVDLETILPNFALTCFPILADKIERL